MNKNKFKRLSGPLCGCSCGEKTKWCSQRKQWNKFIKGHQNRGENNPAYSKDRAKRKREGAPLCACVDNCGQRTKWNPGEGKYNRFIFGHSLKGKNNGMFNKSHSEKTRKLQSENRKGKGLGKRPDTSKRMKGKQYALGYNHTDEWKENNSKIMQGNQHSKGHIVSEKECKKRSKRMKKNNPMFDPEIAIRFIGEGNGNWKGGISNEPYCKEWNFYEFKELIRGRDNNKCQNPRCRKTCKADHKLSVHHIDGDKLNCEPWNLITLCKSCNTRAEGNKLIPRIWWQELYQEIMTEKYGYSYKGLRLYF